MMAAAAQQIAREVDEGLLLITGVCLVLLVGITATMIAFVIRYRRGRTPTTVQIEGHMPLEIFWTVGPTVLAVWMFFVGLEGFQLMRQVPEDAMLVEVTGRQWAWSFHYPGEKIDASEMVVPAGRPVKVLLSAPPNDVIHSFYLPDFRVKEDVLPGRTTYLWFQPERPGTYNIFCAEYCGKDHSKMITVLRVLEEPAYREWIAAKVAERYRPMELKALLDPGHEAFGSGAGQIDADRRFATYCMACHGPAGDGSGLPGQARNFTQLQGWKKSPKVVDIYRTLTEGIPNTQMRSYANFTPWERVALAHRVRRFLGDKAPADTKEEAEALIAEFGLDKVQAPAKTLPIDKAMEIITEEGKK